MDKLLRLMDKLLLKAMRMSEECQLRYFKPHEFGDWWGKLDMDLLQKLDNLRDLWSKPIIISPALGGIGRHDGPDGTSMHNIDKWGKVRALDLFPMVPNAGGGFRYMRRLDDRWKIFEMARKVGFTGIGLYTDTQPGNMIHVDNRSINGVALWSRINKKYENISEALS